MHLSSSCGFKIRGEPPKASDRLQTYGRVPKHVGFGMGWRSIGCFSYLSDGYGHE